MEQNIETPKKGLLQACIPPFPSNGCNTGEPNGKKYEYQMEAGITKPL